MEYIFRTPVITKTLFIIIIIVYSAAPLIAGPLAFKTVKWKILGTLLLYVCLSPFIIIFSVLFFKSSSLEIKINPDYIIYSIENKTTTLQTRETEYFVFDYISINSGQAGNQYYQVFELGNPLQKVRFSYRLSSEELKELGDGRFVKGDFGKSLQFKSYGLTLVKKDCTQLIGLVKEYTGLEPAFKSGFFNQDEDHPAY